MARGGGSIRPGGIYHIISRFVGNQWFMAGPVERRGYLLLLGLAIAETDWRLMSYALMSSHVHFAFVAGTAPLAEWLRPMHTTFAEWINERLERTGSIFVKGPNVIEVQRRGVAKLINYIHCNPVRARVVTRPEESDWTSHRAYVDDAVRPDWLDVETGVALAGMENGPAFAAWVGENLVTKEEIDLLRAHPPRRPGRPRLEHDGAGKTGGDPGRVVAVATVARRSAPEVVYVDSHNPSVTVERPAVAPHRCAVRVVKERDE
jgi:REP-associated tyrosine transposase